jgi:hypothetical protein
VRFALHAAQAVMDYVDDPFAFAKNRMKGQLE